MAPMKYNSTAYSELCKDQLQQTMRIVSQAVWLFSGNFTSSSKLGPSKSPSSCTPKMVKIPFDTCSNTDAITSHFLDAQPLGFETRTPWGPKFGSGVKCVCVN